MARFSRRKNVNIMRIGMKIIGTIIGLYASGYMLNVIGDVMVGTCSPFYQGLTLIGWTLNNSGGATGSVEECTGCCVNTTNGSGILAVVGLLAIVWILFEFVDVRM